MPALSPAQAITGAGQQMVFSCPASQMVNPATALIFNKSSYELESSSGQLIPAWGIVPYALAAGIGSGVTLILTTVLTPGVVAAPVASVYVQWFISNETIPDSTDFTAEAIAAAIAGTVTVGPQQAEVGSGVVPPMPYQVTFTLPSWVNTLTIILAEGTPGETSQTYVSVRGNNTQFPQVNPLQLSANTGPGSVQFGGFSNPIPVFPSIDTTVLITFGAYDLSSLAGVSYWIIGSNQYEQQNVNGYVIAQGDPAHSTATNAALGLNVGGYPTVGATNVVNNNTVALTPAPPAGYVYDVRITGSTTPPATCEVDFIGATTGNYYAIFNTAAVAVCIPYIHIGPVNEAINVRSNVVGATRIAATYTKQPGLL
jgi:hypothetical protein